MPTHPAYVTRSKIDVQNYPRIPFHLVLTDRLLGVWWVIGGMACSVCAGGAEVLGLVLGGIVVVKREGGRPSAVLDRHIYKSLVYWYECEFDFDWWCLRGELMMM
jgi:hypothetical protein